jgi:Rha family phage regulatory protein|tara:strand:+ start:448 stop:1161 length:714 start_codon:yes stop_codon:yes gene_type:complete
MTSNKEVLKLVNLVETVKGEPRTTSDLVGKEFGIAHNEILKKITGFIGELSPVRFSEMYSEDTRVVRGREFKTYNINRDGYMFLVMNISNKKLNNKKLAFIDAFNEMEKALLKLKVNSEGNQWLKVRSQSKQMRLQQTDVIKDFVDYATSQGSKSAKFYYKHYTNATYKALGLIQHKKPKLKDTLDCMELSQLMVAENVAKQSIKKHMADGEHYKSVFILVKQDLIAFSKTLMITNQ